MPRQPEVIVRREVEELAALRRDEPRPHALERPQAAEQALLIALRERVGEVPRRC